MKQDLTGRDQIFRNVLSSWGGHMVFIVAGFILPRMIDRNLGQISLGIWDFSWSFVSYFRLAQIGIGSSVNRFVSLHRSVQDPVGLRDAVSSVMVVQMVASAIVVLATILSVLALPFLFSKKLGAGLHEAQWVVFLLGMSLAVQMATDTFNGIITGCHRWDVHNGINAGFHLLNIVGMVIVLVFGGGLRGLATVYLAGTVSSEMFRMSRAFKVCPELVIGVRYFRWAEARKMISFGGKSAIEGLSYLLLIQGNSIVLVSFLGPTALALYSRPSSVIRHVQTLVNKFAFVLTPTASSLQATGKMEDLHTFLINTTRMGVCIAFPMCSMLFIDGDLLLRLWMGGNYELKYVSMILAAGYLFPLTQRPAATILRGLNLHGRVAWAMMLSALIGIGSGILTTGYLGWSLEGTAMSVAVPLTVGNGIMIFLYACRKIGVPVREFIVQSYIRPIFHGIPFAISLLAFRILFSQNALLAIVSGLLVGIAVTGSLYVIFVFPHSVQMKIYSFMKFKMKIELKVLTQQ